MKTFEDLTSEQREEAIKATTMATVENISNGVLEIELVDKTNQVALDRIMDASVRKDSPRLATMMILKHQGIRKEIERLALVAASESAYNDDGTISMKEEENVDSILN